MRLSFSVGIPGFQAWEDVKTPTYRDGKLAEWTFSAPSARGRGAEDVPVRLTMVTVDGGLAFTATADGMEPVTNSDIRELHGEVERRLQMRYVDGSALRWEPWLQIRISEDDTEKTDESAVGLKVGFVPHQRALGPDGRAYRLHNNKTVPLAEPRAYTQPSVTPQGFRLDNGIQTSYVPDTPAIRAALLEVQARLIELRARLLDVLSSAHAEQTLAAVSSRMAQIGLTVPAGAMPVTDPGLGGHEDASGEQAAPDLSDTSGTSDRPASRRATRP